MPTAAQLAIDHWNKTPLFLTEEQRYRTYPWLYEAAEFREHPGQDVLEIGCGTGCDLLQFAKHGARAVGIDITPEHLRLARQRVNGMAQLLYADARRLPFRDESFDYVYSHGVLHHMEQPREAVKEIFRMLRPLGRFNVHLYARWSLSLVSAVVHHGLAWKNWIENSRDPVFIDLQTGSKLKTLFAPAEVKVTKYECRIQVLSRWLGWFLVAKGQKPACSVGEFRQQNHELSTTAV